MTIRSAGLQVVNGFLLGVGLLLAAAASRYLFHVGFCG